MKKSLLMFAIPLIACGLSLTQAKAATKYVTQSDVIVHKIKNGKQTKQFKLPSYSVINKKFSAKRNGYVISSIYYPNKKFVFKSSKNTQYLVYSDSFYTKYSNVKKCNVKITLNHYPISIMSVNVSKSPTIFIKSGNKTIKTISNGEYEHIQLPSSTKNKNLKVVVYNGKTQTFNVKNTVAKYVIPAWNSTIYLYAFLNNFPYLLSLQNNKGSFENMINTHDGKTYSLNFNISDVENEMKQNKRTIKATLSGGNIENQEVSVSRYLLLLQ